jgi:hypothetical protein
VSLSHATFSDITDFVHSLKRYSFIHAYEVESHRRRVVKRLTGAMIRSLMMAT